VKIKKGPSALDFTHTPFDIKILWEVIVGSVCNSPYLTSLVMYQIREFPRTRLTIHWSNKFS